MKMKAIGGKIRRIRWNTCKFYRSKQRHRWYENNKENKKIARDIAKEYMWIYLSNHPCVDCSISDPRVLELDHIKGKKKYGECPEYCVTL